MNHQDQFPQTRLRRLRQTQQVRNLVREISVHTHKLVLPLFIHHGVDIKKPIEAMPGHFQISIDRLPDEIAELVRLGIQNIILFGIPQQKDLTGSAAFADDGIIQSAIPVIKKLAPHLLVMSDICFCEYMEHGHCGVVTQTDTDNVQVDNDETLVLLAKQAVSHAKAGADVIAPSANMDGMVKYIRAALDEANYTALPILSYSAKYASSLYDPFRHAANGAPRFGHRRSYQMDFGNAHEALRECALDITEGADMLMVKPAHTYLDIIYRVKQHFPALPLAAYHTSGEYALIKAAAAKGWVNETKTVQEILTAIFRAGADFIITYYAKEVLQKNLVLE